MSGQFRCLKVSHVETFWRISGEIVFKCIGIEVTIDVTTSTAVKWMEMQLLMTHTRVWADSEFLDLIKLHFHLNFIEFYSIQFHLIQFKFFFLWGVANTILELNWTVWSNGNTRRKQKAHMYNPDGH